MIRTLLTPFARFARMESASGFVLMGCAIIALVWANSPFAAQYFNLWHYHIRIGHSSFGHGMTVHEWINDVLMTIFFLVVGLEIKRELITGELASLKRAALPIAGALGGMLVPAAIYAALNAGHPGGAGWGIPMATDIAFALGVLSVLGSRVPVGLKVFLTALAIVDDLGAIVVIAVFYTADIHWAMLAISLGAVTFSAIGNKLGIRNLFFYIILIDIAGYYMLQSGVHATIAGVLMAFTIPARARNESQDSSPALLDRMIHGLHPYVAFGIMPLFALANAGVRLGNTKGVPGTAPLIAGVLLGLVVGKPVGITLFSWLAVRCGAAALPLNVTWHALRNVSYLGGIGFTMSLFVAGLAFTEGPLIGPAKIGVLGASLLAGTIGWLSLRRLPSLEPGHTE